MEQFSSSPTYLLQALSDDLQSLFGGLLSPRSQVPPKTEDPRNEDPPWLALIQQLVDGYTFRKRYVRLLDLYLWAVVSGRPLMAAALWRRCKHPLRTALIGQEMCGRIRKLRPSSLATREAREMLAAVESICLQATQGMLDNVRSAKSARQILLNQVRVRG